MSKLAKALWETHEVELEPTDRVVLEQNYCGPNIVDVVVTDTLVGKTYVFGLYDTAAQAFVGQFYKGER